MPSARAQEVTPKKILSTSSPLADNSADGASGKLAGRGVFAALTMLGGLSVLSVSLGPMLFSGARGRRIDSVLQAKKSLQIATLGELPTPEVGAEALAGAYDRLFQELLDHQAIGEGKRRSFSITSAMEEEGRSSITANLAIAAARKGYSVLIVDCDLRRPVQHLLFGDAEASPSPGLTSVLVGNIASPADALRETPVPGVRLLSVGDPGVDSPAEMFGSRAMERFVLNVAPRLADLVLYDAPHLLSNEPGRRILNYVDGVLYAVRIGSTDMTRAKRGLEKLAQAGARVVGGVYISKGYFDLFTSVPVPGRATGVEKIVRNTETKAEPESATSEPMPEEPLQTAETDEEPMSNATETAEKPAVETGETGMDDLESVLQGWRRRDAETSSATTFETRANQPEGRTAKDAIRDTLLAAKTAMPTDETAKAEKEAESPAATAPIFLTQPVAVAPEPEVAVAVEEQEKEATEEKPEVSSKKKGEKEEKTEEPVVEAKTEAPEPVVEEVKPEVKVEELAPANAPVAEAKEEKAEEPAPLASAPEVKSEPAPVIPVAAPVAVAPSAPVAEAPAATAPVAARTKDGFQELDVQIDMFPTAPGEMTMRAVTSNAAAVGVPNVVLEMTTQMHAMRGMRAITPSQGDPDAPRIALETSTTDTPDAAKMRILVGEGADAAFEAILKTGEAISVRTGGGANQPSVRLEMNNDKSGGTVVRATVEGNKDRQEVVLEMKREALTDSFSDAKWKNRVSIFGK
jgi:Mrp family chromosome partitioning ATPase